MQQFSCTDDGIHWASGQALGTSDANAFVDDRDTRRLESAATGVERQFSHAERIGEADLCAWSTRRATVGGGFASSHGFRVGATAGIAATRALRLWQQCIQAFRKRGVHAVRGASVT
jgi:hypothetical protein